jgi:glycosyltransferase involved in cell wall biosynthesis
MKVKILSCFFTTSYGTYTDGLRRALGRRLGQEVGVIASNCGCGDPMELNRIFMDGQREFIEFVNVPYYKKSNAAKQWLMVQARQTVYRERARRYHKLDGDADVLHFQQILNAFGSVTAFNWLNMPCAAARVITIHEFDPHQLDHPEISVGYNKADGIIVHTEKMRGELVSAGVRANLIDVVQHGIEISPVSEQPREGIVFYLGHKFNWSKGLSTLLTSLAILKKEMGPAAPNVSIHGHYGSTTPEEAKKLVRESGNEANVRWLNEISFEEASNLYQRTLLCVLPFTGSFAGYPAALAMNCGAPVIGTREAGLPEHLGDAGVWVERDDPIGLASAILRLLNSDEERRRIAGLGRARAESELSWDAIAQKTIRVYEKAIEEKQCRKN